MLGRNRSHLDDDQQLRRLGPGGVIGKIFRPRQQFHARLEHRPRPGAVLDDERTRNGQCQSVSVCAGYRFFIDQPSGDVAPVGLGAQTLYTGVYATDTFDVTRVSQSPPAVASTSPRSTLTDELGNDPRLNGSHSYSHFNPMIGATYKLTPNLTLYGDYAEANRAPTPLELACADPLRPCLIDNALVGDPDLQAGRDVHLRGRLARSVRHCPWPAQLDARRLSRAQHQRHRQCGESASRA